MNVIRRFPRLRRYITGFDAASNELDAPPEVFAPVYRRLRASGFTNFTYHAGEDFAHLLSGIRAVFEAVQFLELGPGNRLGHAIAIGIAPELWRERIGRVVWVRRGERLDDLVVARRLLTDADRVLPGRFDDEIARLSREIYGETHAPELLFQAWAIRGLDPLVALDLIPTDHEPVDPVKLREHRYTDEVKRNADAFKLFQRHHGANNDGAVVKRAQELVEVKASDDIDDKSLRLLQEIVLDEVARRRIALETLPTSNIRISMYKSYAEHHILRWLGLTGGRVMDVCVGSDDPGIFATNLRNEYAHLMREIDAACTKSAHPVPAAALIEALITNGKTWRFGPPPEED